MKRVGVAALLGLVVCLVAGAAGASGSASPFPTPSGASQPGYLEGRVTIGPFQAAEHAGAPAATPPPEAYAARSVRVFHPDGTTLVADVPILPNGTYHVALAPGRYVVDIAHTGIDSAAGLPKAVTIVSGETVRVDVAIDTGIR